MLTRIKHLNSKLLIAELLLVAFVVLCLNLVFVTRYDFDVPFKHWIIAFCNVALLLSVLSFIRTNRRRYIAYVVFVIFFLLLFILDSTLYYFKHDVSSVGMLFEGLATSMRVAARYNPLLPYGLATWLGLSLLIVASMLLLRRVVYSQQNQVGPARFVYSAAVLAALLASPLILNERDSLAFATPADRSLFVKRFGPLTFHVRDIVDFAANRIEPVFLVEEYRQSVTQTVHYGVSPVTPQFGILAGQNIIVIMCETCEQYAFDPALTPNYYWLREHGLYFDNFYSATRTSTYDAEFKSLTSAMYLSQSDNYYYRWEENSFNNALPNILRAHGYSTNSFHDWEGTFFNRVNIHPRLGFERFYAMEDLVGLNPAHYYPFDSVMFAQMAERMAPVQDHPFFSFIITVTPHGPHDYRPELEPYYELINQRPEYADREIEFKTLMAAQMDFDQGLGTLLAHLREQGLLDETMIVLFSDHRNYSSADITARYTPDSDRPYEIDKVPMIIYSEALGSGTSSILGSHYDIAPTILDLVGLPVFEDFYYGQSLFLSIRDDRPIILSHSNWISQEMVVVDDEIVAGQATPERFLDIRMWIKEKIDFYDKLFVIDFFAERTDGLPPGLAAPLRPPAGTAPL